MYSKKFEPNLQNYVQVQDPISKKFDFMTQKNQYNRNFYAQGKVKFVFKIGAMYNSLVSRILVYHAFFIYNENTTLLLKCE